MHAPRITRLIGADEDMDAAATMQLLESVTKFCPIPIVDEETDRCIESQAQVTNILQSSLE